MTLFELLGQLAIGTQTDPQARIADFEKRRDSLDAEVADIAMWSKTFANFDCHPTSENPYHRALYGECRLRSQ